MTALWMIALVGSPDYDEYDGFVVRARDEASARAIVDAEVARQRIAGQVGVFTNPKRATCTRILVRGTEEVIMGSFNAG